MIIRFIFILNQMQKPMKLKLLVQLIKTFLLYFTYHTFLTVINIRY